MGLCLKINEVRRYRGSCLGREVGIHKFPREQRVREGWAGGLWSHLEDHTWISRSSRSPGWEYVDSSLLWPQYLKSNLRRKEIVSVY